MDFIHFMKLYRNKKDPEMSERAFVLAMYRKVLDGSYYDILSESFSTGNQGSGNAAVNILEPNKYHFTQSVGMSQRRPSVRSALCTLVVDEAVSFVFDENHFPRISAEDKELEQALKDIIEESQLNLAMIQVTRDGSVGSAALLVKLIQGRFYFESLLTEYCTPIFDPNAPTELLSLVEQSKVSGEELIAQGYKDIDPKKIYYFRREWTRDAEIVYKPWLAANGMKMPGMDWAGMTYVAFENGVAAGKVDQNGNKLPTKEDDLQIDIDRTCQHNLGFVPIIWTKNLPGNIFGVQGNSIDGGCTFARAIDTNTELDYQLSQCGRGLKYSAEPLMMIKDDSPYQEGGQIDKSSGGVLVLNGENADAKMVEINGDGCKAVLEYASILREIALENIHGNRSSPKKSAFNASGKAMEMYNHPLILLAGLMRISYGEGMLKPVLSMMAKMMKREPVVINNQLYTPKFNEYATIKLVWPQWFDVTPQEEEMITRNVREAKDARLITQKTAVAHLAEQFGIVDIEQEINEIELEQQQFLQEEKPQIKETINA
jgi:hypothetical protein